MSRKNKTSGIDDLAKALVANHGINGAIAAVIVIPFETPERQDMWMAVLNRLRLMRELHRGF